MLFAVRNLVSPIVVLFTILLAFTAKVAEPFQQTTPSAGPPAASAPTGQAVPPNAPAQVPQSPAPVLPAYTGPVIVIDPGHGGTDSGARGQNGIAEKDIVLQFARVARAELVRQGYKVVLTRDDDSNPSYDDRAAIVNSYRDAIFLSLHVSSTGAPGTARAYYYQFWKPLPPASDSQGASSDSFAPPPAVLAAPVSSTRLTPWNEAQRTYADASRQLADQLQSQMAAVFSGSPGAATGLEERVLRSVAAPAVAIEISSVAVPQARSLTVFAGPLAGAIGKGVQSFRPLNGAGAK